MTVDHPFDDLWGGECRPSIFSFHMAFTFFKVNLVVFEVGDFLACFVHFLYISFMEVELALCSPP
jgi:hypothetical protein